MTNENKLKIDALAEETEANQKAIKGEINAKFEGAEMIAQNAEVKLQNSKYQLDSEKKALDDKMHAVQEELRKKADLTGQEIQAFNQLVTTEHKNLDSNTKYLKSYGLNTESAILELLENTEQTV